MQRGTFRTSSTERARRRAAGPVLTVLAGRPDPVCTRSSGVSRDHPAFGYLARAAADQGSEPVGRGPEAEPEALYPVRSTWGSGEHTSTVGPASSGSGPQIDETTMDSGRPDGTEASEGVDPPGATPTAPVDPVDPGSDAAHDEWEVHRWRFAQRVAQWEAETLGRSLTWSD